MKQGVYKLVNSVNTRVYIGQSIDIENRHKTHIRQLQSNNHHSHKLQSFYNSHKNEKGFNIECEVVEIVDRVELLDGREKYYINKYNSYLDGFNSIGFWGKTVHSKKHLTQMSEAQHWVDEKERYDVFTLKHGDNITLTKDFESVSSSRELKRINLGIDYFLKNFSVDDYVLKVRSHNSAITLWIKGIYFEDLYVYSYDTKSNSFRSQNYLCGYNSSRYTPQCSKLDNNVKSRRRFIWFAKRLSMLDKDIIKHSTIKYTQNSYSIPTSVIAKHIKHTGKRFKKDIITKKVIDELEGINVLYDNKSLQYKEHEHSR